MMKLWNDFNFETDVPFIVFLLFIVLLALIIGVKGATP